MENSLADSHLTSLKTYVLSLVRTSSNFAQGKRVSVSSLESHFTTRDQRFTRCSATIFCRVEILPERMVEGENLSILVVVWLTKTCTLSTSGAQGLWLWQTFLVCQTQATASSLSHWATNHSIIFKEIMLLSARCSQVLSFSKCSPL